jgi:hypothetical protein
MAVHEDSSPIPYICRAPCFFSPLLTPRIYLCFFRNAEGIVMTLVYSSHESSVAKPTDA